MNTTIAAISSPAGAGLRGVVRLSGPDAAAVVRTVFSAKAPTSFDESARAVLAGRFDDGRGTQPALLVWMPGPRSYTREDVAEFHLPGAEPLLVAALERVLEVGATSAAPGEFTRRAFLSGRLDLARAEGVLALVSARHEAERRAALSLLAGGLSARVARLRESFENLRALCEASLDFDQAETGHVPSEELTRGMDELQAALVEAHTWERERVAPPSLPVVVLVGRPNAGKSSLFNALTSDGAALVSRWKGTTRDHLSGLWRVGDRAFRLIDTPGWAEEGERLSIADQKAQELAAGVRRAADLWLHVFDATDAESEEELLQFSQRPPPSSEVAPTIRVWNQIDREGARPAPPLAAGATEGAGGSPGTGADRETPIVSTSAWTSEGLSELGALVARFLGDSEGSSAGQGISRDLHQRHQRGLEEAALALEGAREALGGGAPLDLVAEELRAATFALDSLEGRTTPEDLLDRIFQRFCLGK